MKKNLAILALLALTGCAYQKSQYVLDIESAPLPTTPEATASECARIYEEIDKNNQAMARSYQDGGFTMRLRTKKMRVMKPYLFGRSR